MSYETILVDKSSATLNICLNRPEIGNAFNTIMRDELFSIFEMVLWDTDIKSILLTASGNNFCTGADLTEFGTSPSLIEAREIRRKRDLWEVILECEIPIVSAIQGQCIGSGMEIALLTDIRIATSDSTFCMPEPKLGLIPAAGGTQTLPRTIKLGKAYNALLTGEAITSDDALTSGIISRQTTTANLIKESLKIIDQINHTPRSYLCLIKHQIHSLWVSPQVV